MSGLGQERILVIKLGALGDFIHAFHAFAAIRAYHDTAAIDLLTTRPFAAMAEASPWFDRVLLDVRPAWWDVAGLWRLARVLRGRGRGYGRVYDLQTSRRSGRYFWLAGRPVWSGIAAGCALPHANPARDRMHTVERQREQLMMAGIAAFPRPEREWMVAMGRRHGIEAPYALLIPGDSHGPGSAKRWPIEGFGAVAQALATRGVVPVVVGGPGEAGLAVSIRAACPAAVDLTGRTTMPDLAALGAGAVVVVGNDTGPLHLASASGGSAVALFSGVSSVAEAGPRGPAGEPAVTLSAGRMEDLPVGRVMDAVMAVLDESGGAGRGTARGGMVREGEAEAEEEEEPAADG